MVKVVEDPYYMLRDLWRRALRLDNAFLRLWRPFQGKQLEQLSVVQHILWNIYDWSVPFSTADGDEGRSLLELARARSPTHCAGMATFIGPIHLPQTTSKSSYLAHLNSLVSQKPPLIERLPRGDEQEVVYRISDAGQGFVEQIRPYYHGMLDLFAGELGLVEMGELSALMHDARPQRAVTDFDETYDALRCAIECNPGTGRRQSLQQCIGGLDRGTQLEEVVGDVQRRLYMGRAMDGPAELVVLGLLLTGAFEITDMEELGEPGRTRMRALLHKLRLGARKAGEAVERLAAQHSSYSLG